MTRVHRFVTKIMRSINLLSSCDRKLLMRTWVPWSLVRNNTKHPGVAASPTLPYRAWVHVRTQS